MNAQQVEQALKNQPATYKAEAGALAYLSKGFQAIEKQKEAKVKGGQPLNLIQNSFEVKNETSKKTIGLMKYVGQQASGPQSLEGQIKNNKWAQLKTLKTQVDSLVKKANENNKKVTTAAKAGASAANKKDLL